MSLATMEDQGSRGAHESSALARGTELGPISVGLSVAAIEFAACAAILLAVTALGVASAATATVWAAVILVPLAATIGFLGVRVGFLTRLGASGHSRHAPEGLPEAV